MKMLFLKDTNNYDCAINTTMVTSLTYDDKIGLNTHTRIDFQGGGFIHVIGTVEEIASAIRLHRMHNGN